MPPDKHCYRFGSFKLETGEGVLSRSGNRVKLQDLPCRLLVMLIERAGEIVTREEVRQRLWPDNTFVEFDNSLGVAIRKVRDSLGDDAEAPRYVETVPRRGYRFIAPVHIEEPVASPGPTTERVPSARGHSAVHLRTAMVTAVVAVGIALVLAGWLWWEQTRSRLPERASVVVGEFSNSTGNPVFDGSLRRAVVIQFAQSPYLNVLADGRLGEILQDLGRSPEERLTPALARDVCLRGRASASITGSIQASAGSYLLSMEAERCADGNSLAHETLSVPSQQQVLPRLGALVDDFRRRLGESRESLQKFDVPVEQATTSSLDALKAYQLGLDLRAHLKNLEARPAFKMAITLDPNFAIAYAQLGSSYSNLGNTAEAKKYFQKAFELRARATEPERLYITGRYFDIVTGETEKGAETYKLWTELYPNEWRPYNAVANDAYLLGRYETVIQAAQQSVLLGPNQDFGYSNLIAGLIALNRLDEAKKICDQLMAQGHDNSFIHLDLFAIAFLRQDQQSLEREIEWAQKHPDNGDMVYARAQAAAAVGKINESTRMFEQAAKLDVAAGDLESAANCLAVSAEINSEVGWTAIAQKKSEEARRLGENEIVLGLGGVIAARAHDLRRAHELLGELEHDYPLSTFNLGVFSPMVRTMMTVSPKSSASEVSSLMEPALPYELGFEADMLPIYVRGTSYLEVHSADQAEREFQKLIDHRSVDAVSTLYPLSQLGVARAYAVMGKKKDSQSAYQQFFKLWREADRNLPILLQARREATVDGVP